MFILYLLKMDSNDLLFDMWFLEAEENEKLKDDIEDLEDENEELKEELAKRKASTTTEEDLNNDIDLDEATYFVEDFQTIAAENWKQMEIGINEARRAINLWFSPEEYYEYKINK